MLLALNFTTFLAGMLIVSPDCGFLPSRAARSEVEKVPNPAAQGKVFTFNAYPHVLEEKVGKIGHKCWNWHSLRRRRVSIWAKDKPLFEIMMLLGYSQIGMTQRYLFQIGIVIM